MKQEFGFSLVEVLVALIVISVGVLGLVALQGRTLQYTNESSQRTNAVMLANDLVELMRSNRAALVGANGLIRPDSPYFKLSGSGFPNSVVASCATSAGCSSAEMAQTHLANWATQVRNTLPLGNDAAGFFSGQYVICRTQSPTVASPCSDTGSNIMIQIAWQGKEACPAGATCTSIDQGRREFYRVTFQP
ncbi:MULTISPECIES: type IV pilus modification protein PilV [Pseudomonadaceae]|jgi:type IV pilus assembly protein PilV|uniref:type IV pilus modification protein PilV n=1 Tax=Pseudomonadaceae TaxID=135621 RepID=UPI0005CB7249|nr:type IV pilus modification protein PilV [Pseudomonas otitidis]